MIAAAMGWIGTAGSICAYVLLSQGRWHAQSLRYSALNGLAGVLAGGASAAYGAWPSVAANIVWTAIAVQSAATTLRSRRSRRALLEQVSSGDDHDPEPPASPHLVLVAA
jgi:hypothetical protein